MGRVLVQQPGTNTAKASTETLPKNVIIVDEDLHKLRLHDGVTPGGHIIGGGSADGSYHPSLFAHEWDDKIRDDVQWLRADTFSWQAGSVYQAAYKHLRNEIYNWYSWENNGTKIYTKKPYPEVGEKAYSDSALTTEVGEITDVTYTLGMSSGKITVNSIVYNSASGSRATLTTEIVGGVTVQFFLADDGHKICPTSEESNVTAIYNTTGVAWYYILDTANRRFKLPRTKFGFVGLRDTVGKYVEPGLPNITGYLGLADRSHNAENRATGCFSWNNRQGTQGKAPTNDNDGYDAYFDASQSNAIYGASTTVQQPATQMYLYFYVGEFTQTALENTAGLNAELFNDKQDKLPDTVDYVVAFQRPTSSNNYTWYRKYKSGWVEQGGKIDWSVSSVTLPITMNDSNYTISLTGNAIDSNNVVTIIGYDNQSTTGFVYVRLTAKPPSNIATSVNSGCWEVKGMYAQ